MMITIIIILIITIIIIINSMEACKHGSCIYGWGKLGKVRELPQLFWSTFHIAPSSSSSSSSNPLPPDVLH